MIFYPDPSTMTFALALALGLVFGMGPCNISCFPYLAPVFFAREGGISHAWRTILPFSLGRLFGYSMLGLLCGLAGALVQDGLDAPWVGWILGSATITVGISLLFRNRPNGQTCSRSPIAGRLLRFDGLLRLRRLLPGGLFFMGFGMALTPCAPLGAVMIAASATTSTLDGFLLGMGFGLGAIIIPALVFGVGVAYFGEQIRKNLMEWRGVLEQASATLLIAMGTWAMMV